MKFPSRAPVAAAKRDALSERIARLGIELSEVQEKAITAGGPGGQKVNKSASGVQLLYPAREIVVKWTSERSRALNRFLALRELADRVEMAASPETSARLKARDKKRKQKVRRRRRAKKKAGG